MDNNIEALVYNEIVNNKINNNIEEDNSYEIEKLLQEISVSCLSQYDKDRLLQSLYYCHGGNIDYFRIQLNNKIKDYSYQDKISQFEQISNQMEINLEKKQSNLNSINTEINSLKQLYYSQTLNLKHQEVQDVFQSKIERIKSEIIERELNNICKK
ncbi:hypothetical protein DDB_G0282481 [Dictyostelium discoideum AX4]|uniref:Uncharacterized protein n=1 Tax=Dictyostelium discoideum TaxID=44689 RepID=Q54SG4_DICDI|nr:hypothetical protein DDB_G0282481 [Dictyostelium discoideum AX4]EAL66100.1 hypothetical protein DDB_G0282481 [Dictyostelium discoideum AX4]|eukprot:XP_640075.1 hypothetical protein DDB_G0282481 [Dictyostelium discoideum AX4]